MNRILTCTAANAGYPPTIELQGLINMHAHPRDEDAAGDGRAELLIPNLAKTFEAIIGIGNTKVALTTPERARAKKAVWQALVPAGMKMEIFIAGLMTEATTPEQIIDGYDHPNGMEDWRVMKMFLRAVSNAGGNDVDDVRRVIPCIKAMTYTRWKHKKDPMVLMVHAERKFDENGDRISILDRERAAVERDINFILSQVPDAVIVICHISDASTLEAVRYYRSQGFQVFGEIAPHYSEYCLDDLFEDGKGGTALNSCRFCLPVFKTEKDRQAILTAMVSGEPYWHCGLDDACHIVDPLKDGNVKTNRKGITVGGQTQIPEAVISYTLEKFVDADKLDFANAFLSQNGRRLLGLPPSGRTVTFRREDWTVPATIDRYSTIHGALTTQVAMAGQTRKYRIA